MDLTRFEQRLHAIEERLAVIEKKLALPTPLAQSGWHEPEVPASNGKAAHLDAVEISSKSGNWLGTIAVVCFVLAAGFIIKLSIDSGWLTPARQIVIAAVFGMSLIGSGLAMLSTYRGYASLLPAAGVIILYLSVFAAHRLYALVPADAALILTSLVSLLCIGLYLKIKHDVYALCAAVGAYLSPVILGFHAQALFTVYYFVCCSLTFATLSIWLRSRLMTIIAAYLAILITSLIGLDLNDDATIAVVLALHFLIFALGTYLFTRVNQQELTEKEAWGFFPVLMLFYAMEYFYIDRGYPGLAPWLSLLFAGLLLTLYVSAKRWFPDGRIKSQPVIFAFVAIVLFHSFYIELLPADIKPWVYVAIMLALAFLPFNPSSMKDRGTWYVPALIGFIILAIEYINIINHLLQTHSGMVVSDGPASWLPVAFAALISTWLVLIYRRDDLAHNDEKGSALLGAAHVLAIAGFYRLADPYGSLAVSACWLFYAIAVMAFAYQRRDKTMAKSALVVLGFAAGKALLYDAASTPTLVRIFCLLLTGAVLYGAGFLMKKIAEWEK
ncbi:hypothetical protein Lrub_2378 [Legionella rubrilucens]|uniref:DUF2339 domain-containing protein n=1 Tax=Legionella rubrilucens TaxID=458 RepID=A0A0W0XLN0_9GAMM|nr:DUF2339 domain-containing protein [Legionella rubrilucens]KTD45581.1 hypothetical protein Lrub_2378 [Legionella rubrilucens]